MSSIVTAMGSQHNTAHTMKVIVYPRLTITHMKNGITLCIQKIDGVVQKRYFLLDNEYSGASHFRRSKKYGVGVVYAVSQFVDAVSLRGFSLHDFSLPLRPEHPRHGRW